MDIKYWIIILVAVLLAIAVVAIVIKKIKGGYSAKIKGNVGEKKVAKVLGDTKEGEQYVFNDYMLAVDEAKSCQIDHILIRPCGVIVIETKSYSGIILGNEKEREWTQILSMGRVKNKFYNPCKQNATHVFYLSKILPKGTPIASLVVFAGGADISRIEVANVTCLENLRKDLITDAIRLSKEEMANIAKILEANNAKDSVSLAGHIDNIQAMQEKIANNICPRCGGKLVLRDSEHGSFWGCENYPKCKFTKPNNLTLGN